MHACEVPYAHCGGDWEVVRTPCCVEGSLPCQSRRGAAQGGLALSLSRDSDVQEWLK